MVGAFILYTYVIKPIWFSFKSPLDNFIGDETDVNVIAAIHESVKDGPSDIEGMTKSQKANAGLNPADGSDSDFDGLTDKQEIEEYKSDPLKASTAGDLYTDGYKVAHGMDLFTKYDYDKDTSRTEHGITLTAASPFDFNATISNCTDSIDKYKEYESDRAIVYDDVYEVYKIKNYSNNTLTISKDAALINNKPADGEKVGVMVFKDEETSPIKNVNVEDSEDSFVLTFEEPLVSTSTYTVFLYNDKGIVGSVMTTFDDVASGVVGSTADATAEENAQYQSLITAFPWATLFFGSRPTIYISETATDEQIGDTLRMATTCYHESRPLLGNKTRLAEDLTIDNCKIVPRSYIEAKTKFLESVIGVGGIYMGIMSDPQFLYCYAPLDAYSKMYAAEREEAKELAKKFISGDRFCFKNFNTDYYSGQKHGNCAGYA